MSIVNKVQKKERKKKKKSVTDHVKSVSYVIYINYVIKSLAPKKSLTLAPGSCPDLRIVSL